MNLKGPQRLKVKSNRNSKCSYWFAFLDWNNWWTDCWHDAEGKVTHFYLHVQDLEHETVQRVYCRKSETPRLEMKDGELYWLIDKEQRS